MTLFTTAELDAIKAEVATFMEDTSINTTIKYRRHSGESFNVTTQQYSRPWTDTSGVSALKGVVTERYVKTGISVGDTFFSFMQSAVSGTLTPSADLIVESGSTFTVKKLDKDPLGISYKAYVEVR